MNNFGNNVSLVGVTGIVQGDGIVCTPNPISKTGVISLSPAVTAAISKTQHIRTDGGSTIIDGSLVIHGPITVKQTLAHPNHRLARSMWATSLHLRRISMR